MTVVRPRRSALYMPGANARAVAKARTLPVDAVILDLEDSVAPDAKAAAREAVANAVREGGFGNREVIIRVNGATTEWGRADLEAAVAAEPDAILLPKVSSPDEIAAAEAVLGRSKTKLWAMIETPAAILRIDAIAAAARGGASPFSCMILGTNDLAKETRARMVPGRAPMLPWLTLVLAAGRAHGLDVLDGVYNDIKNLEGFRAECEQGRDLGMDGKTLIHPDQIAIANEVFAPPETEVEAARAIIAAFALPENQGRGVITMNGRMVELLHAEMAERTVALADAIATAQG